MGCSPRHGWFSLTLLGTYLWRHTTWRLYPPSWILLKSAETERERRRGRETSLIKENSGTFTGHREYANSPKSKMWANFTEDECWLARYLRKVVFKATDNFYEIVMRFNFLKMRKSFDLCKLYFVSKRSIVGSLSYRPLKRSICPHFWFLSPFCFLYFRLKLRYWYFIW